MATQTSEEAQKIALLKSGDSKTISSIYMEYRDAFGKFAGNYRLEQTLVLDIYQDAVVALCENAKKGLLDNLKCSIKTYLFSIGKFMIYKRLRTETSIEFTDELMQGVEIAYETYDEDAEQAKVHKLRSALQSMGEPCNTILSLFYFEEKKLDEIMGILDYKNKDVLKSQKSRCLNKLKALLS